MQRTRRSCSPTRAPSTGRSPARAPPVKGGSYNSELMRILRERDEMQAMLDRYERHLSEVQANIKVLSTERDKISMQYQQVSTRNRGIEMSSSTCNMITMTITLSRPNPHPGHFLFASSPQAQEEIVQLRREMMKSKLPRSPKINMTVQTILKRLEAERDKLEADLRRMTTERDSLREQLKISQETAISNRAHLEQRVEDLQTTILTLEQERGEQKSRQTWMKEAVTRLEEEVHNWSSKMAVTEEELSKAKTECSILRQDACCLIVLFFSSAVVHRLSNSQVENALSESQRKLTSKIAELQSTQERNKQMDKKNERQMLSLTITNSMAAGCHMSVVEFSKFHLLLQESGSQHQYVRLIFYQLIDICGFVCLESLKQMLTGLREEVSTLQITLGELDQRRDTLQEQLEVKNTLLTTANEQLENKEKTMRSLQVSVEELEKSVRSIQGMLSEREHELDATQMRLNEVCKELTAAVKAKEAALRENTQLQADLEKSRLESQVATQTGALKREADNSTLEAMDLKRKIQDYVADISRMEDLLASKERECRELQESRRRMSIQAESWEEQARQAEGVASEMRLELLTSETERQKLKDKVEGLEASLQEALSAERSANSQVSQLNRSLLQAEEELRQAQSERTAAQSELEKTRQLCIKLDDSKELVLQELDSCRSEVELLRKQLVTERLSLRDLEAMLMSLREKEHQQLLNSQERQTELQLLRDKLSTAENIVSSQSREVAQIRTRSAQLEADLEMTKRQLSTERFERQGCHSILSHLCDFPICALERAVQELRRQGLSTALRPSSPLAHRSHSPRTSWSPEHTYHGPSGHLLPERSLERSVILRDPYD
ncbi:testis-specific protein 10-like [Scleropages formosus]|uniref:Testis-specific protein 10-like n=1 Tax=Scleropages formosus TaxID=113540 RepID=A0A0P7U936_SCLFO|nr:testis-specific protein 10-like [Scleropages formosus]